MNNRRDDDNFGIEIIEGNEEESPGGVGGGERTENGNENGRNEEFAITKRDMMIMKAPKRIIILISILAFLCVAFTLLTFNAFFLIGFLFFIILGALFLGSFLKTKIPTKHKGIVTIWGARKLIVKNEGTRLLAPSWPFRYTVIPIDVSVYSYDFKFTDIRTRSLTPDYTGDIQSNGTPSLSTTRAGGELEIDVSTSFRPAYSDPSRLINYQNNGERQGVLDIMDDIVGDILRQSGQDYDWERFTFSKKEVAEKIREALERHQKDNDLGIEIIRVNIARISEKGRLKEAAEDLAVEEQQRRAERTEAEHLATMFGIYQDAGYPIEDIAKMIQVERGKASRVIIDGLGGSPYGALSLGMLGDKDNMLGPVLQNALKAKQKNKRGNRRADDSDNSNDKSRPTNRRSTDKELDDIDKKAAATSDPKERERLRKAWTETATRRGRVRKDDNYDDDDEDA